MHFSSSYVHYSHIIKTITWVHLFKITEAACYNLPSNQVHDSSLASVVFPLHLEIIAEKGKQFLQEWHTKSYDNSIIKIIFIQSNAKLYIFTYIITHPMLRLYFIPGSSDCKECCLGHGEQATDRLPGCIKRLTQPFCICPKENGTLLVTLQSLLIPNFLNTVLKSQS